MDPWYSTACKKNCMTSTDLIRTSSILATLSSLFLGLLSKWRAVIDFRLQAGGHVAQNKEIWEGPILENACCLDSSYFVSASSVYISDWDVKWERWRQFEASPVKLSSPAGLTALIQTEQDVTTAVGDEACLSCQLLKSKEILQITWQKVLPEGEDNVATFNKYFGQRVNADFQGKVEIKNNGVQNCSIVIKNVTEEDEGCYRCVFNTYPDGAFIGNTCLRVYSKNLYAFITKCIEVNHLCSTWKCKDSNLILPNLCSASALCCSETGGQDHSCWSQTVCWRWETLPHTLIYRMMTTLNSCL